MTSDELRALGELVAEAVADRLGGRLPRGPLLTTSEAAAYLNVEPSYVYAHATELAREPLRRLLLRKRKFRFSKTFRSGR